MSNDFNVRVYGICIKDDRLLINEELIKNRTIIKLPGGGLDIGEGTIDCVKREWKEELAVDITVVRHFYTTDFFQQSAYDDSQIISIYYLVAGDIPEHIVNQVPNERTYWVEMAEVSSAIFTLPIDKVVGDLLQEQYRAGLL